MVNHPNRSQKSVDAAVKRLLIKYSLARVVLTVGIGGVSARAEPDGFHPLVKARREAAFAELGDMTLAQASEIQTESMKSVASGIGKTVEDAVADLAAALGMLASRRPPPPQAHQGRS